MSDYCFLDANVLFTAVHNPRGKAAFLCEWQSAHRWHLCSSAHATEEARRNLANKFPACSTRLDELLADIATVAQPPATRSLPIELSHKDRPILAAALNAGCSHLLTGDRQHFGASMNAPETTQVLVIQTVGQ